MDKKLRSTYKKIFTPQGELGSVQKRPNLDFLMNIFNIPRIFGVSGFGSWNVGQHSLCTAFIALYWAKHRKYNEKKRDALVTLAMTHDLHEAVTGDILPYFKTQEVREMIDEIQGDITGYFGIKHDSQLEREVKLIDMVGFLYEIHGSPMRHPKNITLLDTMAKRQKQECIEYAQSIGVSEEVFNKFLTLLYI